MDFKFSHLIPATRQEVARALLDVDYQNSLSGLGPLSERRVLDQQPIDGGRVRRRVRCVVHMDVSGPAKRVLGDAAPAWVEEAVWDPDRTIWEWRILPEVGGDLLTAHGDIRLDGVDGGTERRVTGTVRVRVPFYGGKVERWIVDGLRQAYGEEAERLSAWLRNS
ncbi:MAG TPA: DUF2505 domain-containing protein [Actinomycetota bacterium]|nr:DUF2505 domain-containing protein [Actinomycetota bacterium]